MKTFQSTGYLLLIGLSLFIIACKKDTTNSNTYKNSFSLAITGSSWSASSVSATVNTTANAIVITATDGGSQKIDIYISKDISSGTDQKIYKTSMTPASGDLLGAYYSIGDFTLNTKTFSDWLKTSLKITEHDKTNRILKGSFTGGGVMLSDNSTPTITGGGFDIKY